MENIYLSYFIDILIVASNIKKYVTYINEITKA